MPQHSPGIGTAPETHDPPPAVRSFGAPVLREGGRWLPVSRRILPILSIVALVASSAFAGEANDTFSRGDANRDGALNIADAVFVLDYLFGGAGAVLPCQDAADANDDGAIDIADPILMLGYLFVPPLTPLVAPFPNPGSDPTADGLTCAPIDCANAAEVDALLTLLIGTYPLPGAVPPQTITQSGVTVEIFAADAVVTVDSVSYDPITDTFSASGTAGAPAVPTTITAFLINVSCDIAVTGNWSMTGSLDTIPISAEASEVVGVTPGSVTSSVTNTNIDFSACGGIGVILSIVSGLFDAAIQDAIDQIEVQLEAQITQAVDAVIGTTPLIVCE